MPVQVAVLKLTHCNLTKNKKPFPRCCSGSTILSVPTNANPNCDQKITVASRNRGKRFKNWYCLPISFQHGYASTKPENGDEFLTRFQAGLCKQWDAFRRFSRPHTVIGTVSSTYMYIFLSVINIITLGYRTIASFTNSSCLVCFQVIGISSVSLLPLENVTDLSTAFFVGLLKVKIQNSTL